MLTSHRLLSVGRLPVVQLTPVFHHRAHTMSLFGYIGVEEPKFTLREKKQLYEIRTYAPQLRAEYTYEVASDRDIMAGANSPFRALAGFIFGGNTKNGKSEAVAMTAPVVVQKPKAEKIAMTSPVVVSQAPQASTGGGEVRTMAFILPSQYRTADQVPVPNNAAVKVTNVPAHTVAAITFKGYMSSQQADKERELRAACATDGIGLSTDPEHVQYCSYNPPWCLPWFRKNEILVRLVDQQWGIRSFALSDDEGDGSPAASPVGG